MEKTAGLEGTIRDLTQRKLDEPVSRQLSVDNKANTDHALPMIWYKDTKNTFIRSTRPVHGCSAGSSKRLKAKRRCTLSRPGRKYYRDDLDITNSGRPTLDIIEHQSPEGSVPVH